MERRMKIFKGITKIIASPLRGVKEVIDDISGENSDTEQGLSILTTGISSIVKGTAKGFKSGIDDIFE
jgi:phage-related protein